MTAPEEKQGRFAYWRHSNCSEHRRAWSSIRSIVSPQDFVFKIARTQEEIEGFWALRRAIFCEEQKVFQESDRDESSTLAIPIVCETLIAGMEDSVVGVVRIDEREENVWYGSRLGVARFSERQKNQSRRGIQKPPTDSSRTWPLGAGLIYKAVSTAHALGCREFLATVQYQNAKFFQRLHWEPLSELELFGLRHVKMRADLGYYRPAESVF